MEKGKGKEKRGREQGSVYYAGQVVDDQRGILIPESALAAVLALHYGSEETDASTLSLSQGLGSE